MTTRQLGFDLNTVTALGPNDPDDGDTGRQKRGMAIAALTRIEKNRLGYKIPSASGNGSYVVSPGEDPFCTCPDFEARQQRCKHVYAVEFTMQREERPDGTTVETKTVRFTPVGQDWPAYNAAQVHEQEHFGTLLRELCDTVPQPSQAFGRPRLPLADVLFGVGLKVYSTMSGRRAMTDFRDAAAKGMLGKVPSFTSTFRYIENPDLTPLLKSLIERSAAPLQSVEADFAVDSSGFSTSVYSRWFDHKWGKERKEAKWVKAHIICGVKTNIITSTQVDVTGSGDAPQLPALVNATARTFDVREVSADKAYSSRKNLAAIEAVGAEPFVPFRENTSPPLGARGKEIVPENDSAWARAYHFYAFNRETFLQHYHKRSNVETTFSMIKAKFGSSVRSKTPVAQVNEVLCKILCHNICVLIQSMYELGVAPMLGLEAKQQAA